MTIEGLSFAELEYLLRKSGGRTIRDHSIVKPTGDGLTAMGVLDLNARLEAARDACPEAQDGR